MSTDTNPKQDATRLLDYLQRYRSDRGALAQLRCGLRASQQSRAWPLLARHHGIPAYDGDHRAQVVLTVAGLWASAPDAKAPGDFGATCRALASGDERAKLGNSGDTGPMSRHFQRILAAERHEICERVTTIGLRAVSQGVGVHPIELYADLAYWGDRVQERWARSFWAAEETVEEAAQ
jgi:CRISPR system Cascade subunit CasB